MPLIGTAGHVDHGKSTLVRALTGRDPDRLAEEKRRGLTIDLGFAWADLGDGTIGSFVDVPGHERYLKNMLAGVDGLDLALLVVDASEGWMPQTEEHLAVLDLLEVPAGVVALTKTDLVDQDAIGDAVAAVAARVRGTFLEGAPIVPVASLEGSGLAELRDVLARLVHAIPPRPDRPPRLWVDRSFTIAGAGTVVTGSLLGGELALGEAVEIYPSGSKARARSLQSHEERIATARPGTRVALGLAGIDAGDVGRGDMIGRPGVWRNSQHFVARFRLARYVDELSARGAYQLHMGTAIVNATILRLAGGQALIRIDRPLPIAMGDHLILRDTGRRLVVAGGRVLDPSPVRRSLGAAFDENATPGERADQLLELRGLDSLSHLVADSGGGQQSAGVVVGDLALSATRLARIVAECENAVSAEHAANPMRDGVPLATLAGSLRLPRAVVDAAVRHSTRLEIRGASVAETGRRVELDDESRQRWDRARDGLAVSLSVPLVSELALGRELVHLLVRRGELVKVSDDLVYLPEQVTYITQAVGRLEPPFGVGEFKEAIGVSRKYSMPLLEWLDANHYTIRRPEGRFPGPALSGGE